MLFFGALVEHDRLSGRGGALSIEGPTFHCPFRYSQREEIKNLAIIALEKHSYKVLNAFQRSGIVFYTNSFSLCLLVPWLQVRTSHGQSFGK